jgi:hypothetical protein
MALAATLTTVDPESDVFNPSDSVTEFFVDGSFNGTVDLQASRPDAEVWHSVHKVVSSNGSAKEHVLIHTPDTAVDYRVIATGLTADAKIYLGP